MRIPLIERLEDHAPQLELFDERVAGADTRRSLTQQYSRHTQKAHRRRLRRWQEWCDLRGYQAGPEFITSEKLREWTVYMTTEQRYAPTTIWQSLRALEIAAERAGVDVSVEPALGVLDSWRQHLYELGLVKVKPRQRRRGGAPRPLR